MKSPPFTTMFIQKIMEEALAVCESNWHCPELTCFLSIDHELDTGAGHF